MCPQVLNNVKVILKKMTPENIVLLSVNFASLPINTIECLENTVDLVFEKVIYNYINIRFWL